MLYGSVVSTPSDVVPLKNSTCAIEPPASVAVAVTTRFVGPSNVAPVLGLVIEAECGVFPQLTLTVPIIEKACGWQ
jgi:hypothetical protein